MNNALLSMLDDAALLLMMQHPDDKDGLALIIEALTPLKSAIRGTKIVELDQDLTALLNAKGESGAQFLERLRSWVERAQNGLKSGNTAATDAPWTAAWGIDIGSNFDTDLIQDFIDTHPLKLDEFELELVEAAQGRADSPEDVDRKAKAYLHNLKGDAGTVGLNGIERVTHRVEDEFQRRSALSMLEPLREFKEWAITTVKQAAAKQDPHETSEQFIQRFAALVSSDIAAESEAQQSESPPVATAPDAKFSSTQYTLSGEADVFVEFKAEAEDHLERVEEILLERDEGFTLDDVNAIFRAVHSIKGGSSYFNLQEMTRTSHILENLLDKSRKGQLTITKPFKDLILAYIDIQKALFATGKKSIISDRQMQSRPEVADLLTHLEAFLANATGGITAAISETACSQVSPAQESVESNQTVTITEQPQIIESSAKEIPAEHVAAADSPSTTVRKDEKIETKTFVKVDTTRLDRLIEYIGEMVISSSMLSKSCRDLLSENEGVISNTHQLEHISREIQSIGMSMRLVPIKALLQKMSRLVWDTSKKIGKECNFETEGEDTELDRTVVDKLADPLMHMIRNSVDHGVETPDVREAAGKPRAGTVKVSASHFGGSIHIKISDDGKGLNPEYLLKKAIEKGLASPNDSYTNLQIYQFIFAAGFSTAEKVTDISGRGVGMDVVRRNIEAMRGRVHIESQLGKGTVFTIELPLTLAIIDGIETKVGNERFVIPTHSIVEFVKPKPNTISTTLDKGEIFEFRGQYLPIFRLSELNSSVPRYHNPCDAILAVIESNHEFIALMIDEVVGGYSTVIKPLGPTFQHVRGLSGAAIMPDGTIGLIIDTATLISLARNVVRPVPHRQSNRNEAVSTTLVH